jgi:chromosome segregation ATPase
MNIRNAAANSQSGLHTDTGVPDSRESAMLSTLRRIYLPELDDNSAWIQELEGRTATLEEDKNRLCGELQDANDTIRQQEEQISRLRFKLSTLEAKRRRGAREWENSCDDLKEEVDILRRQMKRIHQQLEGGCGSKAPKTATRGM